ncbi:unnamed protein product [Onchocerca flexuosa]|uniref:PUL domain-containing protein n=1 Tax=Onchocerca flexuosa TaxID=387005 RepID=A0A183HTM2_9BILA|nr:unnamed protein product [Onchocerca flexuosa]
MLADIAVLALNAGLISEHAQRNLATARALLPAMMCHIAEALGNIACSSLPVKDQAKVENSFVLKELKMIMK